MRRRSVCSDCGHEVLWTVTAAGKRLAVDPTPDPSGNTAVVRDGLGAYRSRRPTDELPPMGYERLHVPHIATCQGRRPTPAELPPGVTDLAAYRLKARGRP
ncbi:hypothetical protein [Streptomyces sp. DH12]|uniref:hypothetical protein n=1 Tax=Streptomyces sp. DH12 TaxID=2857010 RepID=UPI001E4D92BE|nr:hypothetical protein [Streptomyces sp. DH12]